MESLKYFCEEAPQYHVVAAGSLLGVAIHEGDFGKHIDAHTLPRIQMVWDSIPMQLAKENKKFFFGQIKKGARSSEYELAIQWLVDCGLVYKVNRVNEPNMPLKAYCDKFHPDKAVRFSTLKYIDQGWMENIPLYAVCNL